MAEWTCMSMADSLWWAEPAAVRWMRPAVRSTLSRQGGGKNKKSVANAGLQPVYWLFVCVSLAQVVEGQCVSIIVCTVWARHCKDEFVDSGLHENLTTVKSPPRHSSSEELKHECSQAGTSYYPGEFCWKWIQTARWLLTDEGLTEALCILNQACSCRRNSRGQEKEV